jgi:clan AA aspartic protease (TIGR02281 family)
MNMKQSFIITMFLLGICQAVAQNIKRPESYNYQRGLEAMQEEKQQEALDYFYKDLKENPKNGYSYSWIAMLRGQNGEYGRALTAADMAIKYLPKKDSEYVIFAYTTRAGVYLHLGDTVKAMSDYTLAIKAKPDETDLYDKRAQIYYEQGKFDLADADYHKMVELKPGDVMGYMGLGRNANIQKRWEDAIKQFDYVTKLAGDYSSGYSFRAESYIGLKKWSEATDDIVSALTLEWDRKAMFLATTLKEPAFTMLTSKMKIQSIKSPNEARWPYVIATMYQQNKQYKKAVESYEEANKRNASPIILRWISQCHSELGQYDKALNCINQALNMDSTDLVNLERKANILYEMGNAKSAIDVYTQVLKTQPEYAFGYYRRGWFKELSGDFEGAVEDLSICVVLDPEESYAFETRGDIYLKQGKKKLAEEDFRKVIEIENTPEKFNCIHYAYQGLGQNDKAIEMMDSIIARNEDRAGSYYDAACLYARMNEKQKALEYLEKSFELGYRRFAHIDRDQDMDPIRDMDEFKALIKKYNQPVETNAPLGVSEVSTTNKSTISEIPFTKESGVCKVKCKVNGLPLHFIFDTGASDVTLSTVEATFMMKNGYLSDDDVVGNQRYMDANGDISIGTVINLKNVNFGDLDLNNVRASVVRNQKAPLLLGQSVLGRLGKIEIDNSKNILKITHNK